METREVRAEMEPTERADQEKAIAAALAREAFSEAGALALRAYGPEILGLLVAVMRDERTATEVFSQFSEDLWLGLPKFRGPSSIRTWAYSLAHQAAHRWRRDPLRRRAVNFDDCPELFEVEARVRTETLSRVRTEVKDRMHQLREQLSPDEQLLLALRIDREMKWEDIVEITFGECDDRTRARHVSSLRKRFERIELRLRTAFETDPSLRRRRG
ncbi:MAG: RNA polymerase sigma factor [Polyangiales bacterium]